ncbi:MAG: hypothetical protein AAGG44_13985, partial [Planctomycetota bacterium]
RDSEKRIQACLALAEHFSRTNANDECSEILARARAAVSNRANRILVMDAYLQLLDDVGEAMACVRDDLDDVRTVNRALEILVRHGKVDAAIELANGSSDAQERLNRLAKVAHACADSADAPATEQVIDLLVAAGIQERRIQSILCSLAESLAKDNQLELAKKIADRVTDEYLIRSRRTLRRIQSGVPIRQPLQRQPSQEEQMTMFSWLTGSADADDADRQLQTAIAEAEANPVEDSNGQFGPWNQRAALARIQLQYFQVAALYRSEGMLDEARDRMLIAEEAIRILSKENAFSALISIQSLVATQIRSNDLQGIKRVTSIAAPYLWSQMANQIVDELLDAGDIPGATKIAWRVVSSKKNTMFGKPISRCDKIVSCFIQANSSEIAYELLQSNKNGDHIAAALENAGRAMVEASKTEELLTTKWTDALSAEQRFYLAIGAASATRSLASPDN